MFKHYMILGLMGSHAVLQAGLFLPKQSIMVMVQKTSTAQMFAANYGVTPTWSVGLSRLTLYGIDGARDQNAFGIQSTYTLQRRYLDDGIINFYILGGLDRADSSLLGERTWGHHVGLWADYETTQRYIRLSIENYNLDPQPRSVTTLQGLYAPWASAYGRTTFWAGIELEKDSRKKIQVSPMIRLVNKAWWIDLGVTALGPDKGAVAFTFMKIF